MAYNKAKAEREWLRWKESEESQLRQLGVDEDTIQRLHTYDWQSFCAERRFCEWQDINPQYINAHPSEANQPIVQNVQDLLDSIENDLLYSVLQTADKMTVEILLLKMQGFTSQEIARKLQIDTYAINQRIYRLRVKLKKYF